MINYTDRILELIKDERKRQDEKWGAHRNLDDFMWLGILTEEIGEAAKDLLQGKSCRKELIHSAAVIVAWIECREERAITTGNANYQYDICPNTGKLKVNCTCNICSSPFINVEP